MTKPPTTQILCGTCGQEVTATEVSCSRCGQHLTRGIGGWLLFFILTLVVFGPVARLANFRTHNAHSLELFAQSARPHLLYVLYVIEQVLAFTVSGYGVFAGISLLKRNPAGIERAKHFMIALAAYAFADFLLLLNIVSLAGSHPHFARAFSWEAIKPIVNTVGYTLIWYSYLERSVRVRLTFPATGAS